MLVQTLDARGRLMEYFPQKFDLKFKNVIIFSWGQVRV